MGNVDLCLEGDRGRTEVKTGYWQEVRGARGEPWKLRVLSALSNFEVGTNSDNSGFIPFYLFFLEMYLSK